MPFVRTLWTSFAGPVRAVAIVPRAEVERTLLAGLALAALSLASGSFLALTVLSRRRGAKEAL